MIDLPPAVDLWLPPKPALVRPIEHKIDNPRFLPANRAERRAALRDLVSRKVLTPEQAKRAFIGFFVPATFVKAAAAGGGSFGVTFTDADKDAAGGTSIAGMSLGAEDANRYMLVVGFARQTSNLILSSVTIGGAATTEIFNARRDGSSDILSFAFVTSAALASGTTGTVALTFGTGTPQFISAAVYRIVTTGSAPTVAGNGGVSGSGTSSTSNRTADTTGTTPFVVYGCLFTDEAAVLTPGGTGLTSPVTDYSDNWGASSAAFIVVSDDSPGVNAAATFNTSSSVSTVWTHGVVVITP